MVKPKNFHEDLHGIFEDFQAPVLGFSKLLKIMKTSSCFKDFKGNENGSTFKQAYGFWCCSAMRSQPASDGQGCNYFQVTFSECKHDSTVSTFTRKCKTWKWHETPLKRRRSDIVFTNKLHKFLLGATTVPKHTSKVQQPYDDEFTGRNNVLQLPDNNSQS